MKPLYKKIIENITAKIKSGEWNEGDMLPTEHELCELYGVSRQTIRTALLQMVNDGYLYRTKGKGTFVTHPTVMESSTIFLESFSKEMNQQGRKVKNEVLEFRKIVPPEEISQNIGTPLNEEVIKLTRLRYQEGFFNQGPIVLTTTWSPKEYSYLLKYDFEKVSMHDVLKQNGIVRKITEKEIDVCVMDPKSCRLMGMPEGTLAIYITSKSYNQNNKLIEYVESLYPASRNTFKIRIRL